MEKGNGPKGNARLVDFVRLDRDTDDIVLKRRLPESKIQEAKSKNGRMGDSSVDHFTVVAKSWLTDGPDDGMLLAPAKAVVYLEETKSI